MEGYWGAEESRRRAEGAVERREESARLHARSRGLRVGGNGG